MFLDRLGQNMTSFRQYIILGIFLFLIIVPSFFSGEWSKWLQAIVFIVTFLLIVYTVIMAVPQPGGQAKRTMSLAALPNFYLALFLLAALVTSFFSIDRYSSFSLVFLLASYAAIYFAAYHFFREWRFIQIVVNVIFFTGVLAAVISLVMFVNQSDYRTLGLLFNANALGSYLLFSVPLGLGLALHYRQKKVRYVYGAGFLVVAMAFLLSYSYTGWVSFLIPLIILIYYFRRTILRRRNIVIFSVLLIICFLVLAVFRYQNTHNIGEALQVYKAISYKHLIFSFSQRLNFNRSAWEIFRDHPLTGTGLNTFQSVYGRYYRTLDEQPRYVHDYYMQTGAEIGIFGFLSLMAFVFFLFKNACQLVKNEPDEHKKTYLLLLGVAILGSAIHALFDFGWQFPAVFILFWLGSGMLVAWSRHGNTGPQLAGAVIEASQPGRLFTVIRVVAVIAALALFVRGITVFLGAYYFSNADRAAARGDYQEIQAAYQSGLRFDPDPAQLVNYVEQSIGFSRLLTADDFSRLERDLQWQQSVNRQNYYLYWSLGRLYLAQNKYSEAIGEYQTAIKYDPVFRPDFHYDLAYAYFQQKQYGEVEKTILPILELYQDIQSTSNPRLPTQLAFLNLLLGKNYLEQGNREQAKYYFEQALQREPNFDLATTELKNLP